MMLSESSSHSFSHASMIFSSLAAESPSESCSMTFSSRSKTLMAYHLSRLSSTLPLSASSISFTAFSTPSLNTA